MYIMYIIYTCLTTLLYSLVRQLEVQHAHPHPIADSALVPALVHASYLTPVLCLCFSFPATVPGRVRYSARQLKARADRREEQRGGRQAGRQAV